MCNAEGCMRDVQACKKVHAEATVWALQCAMQRALRVMCRHARKCMPQQRCRLCNVQCRGLCELCADMQESACPSNSLGFAMCNAEGCMRDVQACKKVHAEATVWALQCAMQRALRVMCRHARKCMPQQWCRLCNVQCRGLCELCADMQESACPSNGVGFAMCNAEDFTRNVQACNNVLASATKALIAKLATKVF